MLIIMCRFLFWCSKVSTGTAPSCFFETYLFWFFNFVLGSSSETPRKRPRQLDDDTVSPDSKAQKTACKVKLSRLSAFWTAICNKSVERSVRKRSDHTEAELDASVNDTYAVLTFSNMDLDDVGVESKAVERDTKPAWGLLSLECDAIVERPEYVSLAETLLNSKNKLASLEGTKGVGKSVFLAWLMYFIVSRPSAEPANPTFVLLDREGAHYYFGYDQYNEPKVEMHLGPDGPTPDYIISDKMYDLDMLPNSLQLFVASYGNKSTQVEAFRKRAEEMGKSPHRLLMSACDFFEVEAMMNLLGTEARETAPFAFAVFGGSARLAVKMVQNQDIKYVVAQDLTELVDQAMEECFCGSEFVANPKYPAWRETATALVTEQLRGSTTGAALDVHLSLLVHARLTSPNVFTTTPASAFMVFLGGIISEEANSDVLEELRSVLGGSGFGLLFERQVLRTLWSRFSATSGGSFDRIQEIRPDKRAYVDVPVGVINICATRKVFIRTIEDIGKLKVGDFGIPIIPNFALYDWFLKTAQIGIKGQITIAKSKQYTRAKGRDPSINTYMKLEQATDYKVAAVFCLQRDCYDTFKYVTGLDTGALQFRALCEFSPV